jgi:hypothetical protein
VGLYGVFSDTSSTLRLRTYKKVVDIIVQYFEIIGVKFAIELCGDNLTCLEQLVIFSLLSSNGTVLIPYFWR